MSIRCTGTQQNAASRMLGADGIHSKAKILKWQWEIDVSETLSESSCCRIDMCANCASSFAHLGRENSGVETDERVSVTWSVTETRLISFWYRFVFGFVTGAVVDSSVLFFILRFESIVRFARLYRCFHCSDSRFFFSSLCARLAGAVAADRATRWHFADFVARADLPIFLFFSGSVQRCVLNLVYARARECAFLHQTFAQTHTHTRQHHFSLDFCFSCRMPRVNERKHPNKKAKKNNSNKAIIWFAFALLFAYTWLCG